MKQKITLTAFLVLITVFAFGQKTELKTFEDIRQSKIENRLNGFTLSNNADQSFHPSQKNRNISRNFGLKSIQDNKQALDSLIIRLWGEVNDFKQEYTYDDIENLTLSQNYTWNDTTNQWTVVWKSEFIYDDNNNQILLISYYWDEINVQWVISSKAELFYDENGFLTQYLSYSWDEINSQWLYSSKFDFVYDVNGNQTEILGYQWDEANNLWVDSSIDEYTYDANGNLVLWITTLWDVPTSQWLPFIKEENTYDGNNNETLKVVYFWYEPTSFWLSSRKYEYTYDSNNNRTQVVSYENIYFEPQWILLYKNEFSYNNSFTYSDLILPSPDSILYNHMLTLVEHFTWDESLGDWVFRRNTTYYYSEHEITTIPEIIGAELKVYPNPFSEFVTFSIPDNHDPFTFELFDLQGRKIMSKEIKSDEKVNMEALNQGVYFYNLIIDDKRQTGKLIKS